MRPNGRVVHGGRVRTEGNTSRGGGSRRRCRRGSEDGEDRSPHRDGKLGVGVHGDWSARCGSHLLSHEGDARAASDEEHSVDLPEIHAGGGNGVLQYVNRVGHPLLDHPLELGSGEPDRRCERGKHDSDRRIGVGREGLFRGATVAGEARHGAAVVLVVLIQLAEWVLQDPIDVSEDSSVEVDATQPFDALGLTDKDEPGGCAFEHGSVEGPAAEVVDGDQRSGFDPFLGGVMDGCRDRLGYELDRAKAGELGGMAQEVGLVRSPARRMGEHNPLSGPALAVAHQSVDMSQHVRDKRLGAEGRTSHDYGCRVPEAALELAGRAGRLLESPPGGGLANQDLPVLAEHDDCRHDRRTGAEGYRLRDATGPGDNGRGEGSPAVDAEHVRAHDRPPPSSGVSAPTLIERSTPRSRVSAGPSSVDRGADSAGCTAMPS